MTPPDFGVTPQGFKIMRLIEAKTLLENLFTNEFSEINLEAQSVAGQIIGIFSKVIADDWENLQDVYLSQYPNSASHIYYFFKSTIINNDVVFFVPIAKAFKSNKIQQMVIDYGGLKEIVYMGCYRDWETYIS